MSKRIAIPELRDMLRNAIARCDASIESCVGETNPQLVEMKNLNIGAKAAYEQVLDALNGEASMLRVSAYGLGDLL